MCSGGCPKPRSVAKESETSRSERRMPESPMAEIVPSSGP